MLVSISGLLMCLIMGPPQPKLFDRMGWLSSEDRIYLPFDPTQPAVLDLGNGQKRLKIKAPGDQGHLWSQRDSSLYLIQAEEINNNEIARLTSFDTQSPTPEWVNLGVIDTTCGHPTYLIPLDKVDAFLAFSWMDGFTHEGKASFAAVFRRDPKRELLTLERLVEMPFEDLAHIARFQREAAKDGLPGETMCLPDPERLHPNLWSPVANQTHVLLAATGPGTIWAFSLKDGSCTRTLNIGGLKASELGQLQHLDHYLLGVQPLSGGDFIAATRHPEILEIAGKLATPVTHGPVAAKAKEDYKTFTKDEGRIQWWLIDGKSFTFRKTDQVDLKGLQNLSYTQAGRLRFLVSNTDQVVTNYSQEWQTFCRDAAAEKPAPKAPASPEQPSPLSPNKASVPQSPRSDK